MAPESHFLTRAQLDRFSTGQGNVEDIATLQAAQGTLRRVLTVAAADWQGGWEAGQDIRMNHALRPDGVLINEPLYRPALVDCLKIPDGVTSQSPLREFEASAALRSGEAIDTTLPVRGGAMHVPAVGRLALHTAHRSLRLHSDDGQNYSVFADWKKITEVTPEEASEGWEPVRYLQGNDGFRIAFDDVSPYRDHYGAPLARRVPDEDFAQLQWCFADAWDILRDHHPHYAVAIAAGLKTIIPLASGVPGQGRSASNAHLFGAISLTRPNVAEQLAVTLVHEFAHNILSGVSEIVPLRTEEGRTGKKGETLYYAPWRDDPRPARGLAQGAYAHAEIADYWRVQREQITYPPQRFLAEVEYCQWRRQVLRTLALLADSDTLNAEGTAFVQKIHERVMQWDDTDTPEPAKQLAELNARDHELTWRLHNHIVDADAVAGIVAAYGRGEDAPPINTVATTLTAKNQDFSHTSRRARVTLQAMRTSEPAWFDATYPDLQTLQRDIPYATQADLYIAQQDPRARQLYLDAIAADPSAIDPWSGLAITFHDEPEHPAAALFLSRPEVVAAVHRTIGDKALSPLALAEWLGSGTAQPHS